MHPHSSQRWALEHRRSPLALAGSLLLAAATLAGCGGNGGDQNAQAPAPSSPKSTPSGSGGGSSASGKTIGVSLASMSYLFYQGMRQGVDEELDKEGLKKEVVVANDSASEQQQQVDQLIQKHVDAIIMVPVDATQAVNPVKSANEQKIPLFTIDRKVTAPGATVTAAVTTDNVAMGADAAKFGLKLLCERHKLDPNKPEDVKKLKATVIHLWGLEAASPAQDRAKGFEQVFNATNTPNVKVLKGVGDFSAKKSQEVVAPMLTANPDVELIFNHNDDNAMGALHAVMDIKKGREKPDDPKRIFIVGIDGNPDAIAEVRKGTIEGTVSQEPIEMGRQTVQLVKKFLEGTKPEQTEIKIPHYLITQKVANEEKDKIWSDQLKKGGA